MHRNRTNFFLFSDERANVQYFVRNIISNWPTGFNFINICLALFVSLTEGGFIELFEGKQNSNSKKG